MAENKNEGLKVCKVHEVMHNDVTPRECKYCEVCSAYICVECDDNMSFRVLTAFKVKLDKLKESIKK